MLIESVAMSKTSELTPCLESDPWLSWIGVAQE